ncbi:MAG TPA: radical SAM protein [Vicinamibacterales bacterium]|nr:radical SAM protein [Vicinamibacterales bacterium]
MQPSIFNLRVPLPARNEVFLMNTLTDAQLVVSADVAALLDRIEPGSKYLVAADFTADERNALELLHDNGFIVDDREADRRALSGFFSSVKNGTSELNVTVLTTLQCNFACDYCFQGDHGDYNKFAEKMSLETAERVADWTEREMVRVAPETLMLTFFGGEPLLNVPVMYYLAERLSAYARQRGVRMMINVITNGLLLTEEIVDRLLPCGLNGIKVTLDGDRDAHNRLRPLRGGQGTFDRIIENVRKVADRCNISIGGNFDESSVDSYPALLDFLQQQEFADKLVKVKFKPIVRNPEPAPAKGFLPLIPVGANGEPIKPLGGTCMTAAGSGGASACDTCQFLDEKMAFLRQETRRHGFNPGDGVHVGPCHVHMDNARTIGPDGSLYPCPGFTGEKAQSVGHIDGREDPLRKLAQERFDRLGPWKECGDCAFIPVCAGGCVVASHTTLGDMNKPTCHKPALESALISLAHEAASAI